MKSVSFHHIFRLTSIISSIFLLMLSYYINISVVSRSFNHLMDFGSFIASGQFSNEGKNPYSEDSPLIFSALFPKINHFGSAPNLNPPISVVLFKEIANTGYSPLVSANSWRIISFLLYGLSIFLIGNAGENTHPRFYWRLIWVLGIAGFWTTVELGQIYIPLYLLAWGIIIYSKKEQSIFAGALLGALVAIKPNFVFWAIALGVAGFWHILIYAGITAFLISLLPLYFYGITIYKQWFEATKLFTPNLLIFPGNNSLQGLSARFGSPETGIIFGVLLATLIIFIIIKYKPSIAETNSIAIITSLLISPIAWTGYILFVVPILIDTKKWEWQQWTAAAILLVPFYVPLAFFQDNFFNFIFFGWFYGWGLLILLISEIIKITRITHNVERIKQV